MPQYRTSTDDSAADGSATVESAETGRDAVVVDEPAFEYDAVKQSPLYARPEAWNALQDALDLGS